MPLRFHHLLNEGEVPYRALRTQFVGCELDIEYLGKVHCLRQAFDYIFSHPESTEWIIKIGKLNVCRLLHCLGYPTTDFEKPMSVLWISLEQIVINQII
ncbi:unnamed protein product [Heterobilharzia americana]|nr:unnamed protein product [Heterobilharzia americana]